MSPLFGLPRLGVPRLVLLAASLCTLLLALAVPLPPASPPPADYACSTTPTTGLPATRSAPGHLTNTGSDAVALSSVTIATGSPRGHRHAAVLLRLHTTRLRERHLEVREDGEPGLECGHLPGARFSQGAGSLAAGQRTGDIQGRITKADWSNFDQRNDYSYGRKQEGGRGLGPYHGVRERGFGLGIEPTSGGIRPPGILRVSGRQIVDDAGRPVALRGVGLGSAVWSDVELPPRTRRRDRLPAASRTWG